MSDWFCHNCWNLFVLGWLTMQLLMVNLCNRWERLCDKKEKQRVDYGLAYIKAMHSRAMLRLALHNITMLRIQPPPGDPKRDDGSVAMRLAEEALLDDAD